MDDVVKSINAGWSDNLGARFEVVSWKTHANPGIGSDPQAVINRQLGTDYDVFIGIMWTRFGSPTPRADSGTEEEFERAYNKYIDSPDSTHVMFYFKSNSPKNLDEINVQQLEKVREFKNKISDKGVLFGSFGESGEFRELVNLHLTRIIQVYDDKIQYLPVNEILRADKSNAILKKIDNNAVLLGDDNDVGYLDLAEIFQENFDKNSDFSEEFGNITFNFGENIKKIVGELKQIHERNGGNYRNPKEIIIEGAEYLFSYSTEVKIYRELFRKHCGGGIRALSKYLYIIEKMDDIKKNDMNFTVDMVRSLWESMNNTKNSMMSMGETIYSLPRATKKT